MALNNCHLFNERKKKKEMNLHTDLVPFTKVNSICFIELSVKCKTKKLLEDSMGENHHHLLKNAVNTTKNQATYLEKNLSKTHI